MSDLKSELISKASYGSLPVFASELFICAHDEISRLQSLIAEHNRKVEVDCLKRRSPEPLHCALLDMCQECPRHYLIPTGEDNDS